LTATTGHGVIHPFWRRLVTEPELFVEHASAYAELASAEARQVSEVWRALPGEVTPLVRRHPVILVAVGAAIGAGLVAGGVLRHGTVRRSVASTGRLARRWLIGELTSPALQTVVIGAITTLPASRLHARDAAVPAAQQHPDDV
jgi:hypothetical protein